MADDHKINVANGTVFVDGEEFTITDVSFETDGKDVKARPTLARPPNAIDSNEQRNNIR